MATYKGVNRTKADTPRSSDSNIMDPGVQNGKLRTMMDTYEASGIAAGSIIEMGMKIPKGARVVEVKLMTDALGSGVELEVGDYEDPNRYITATGCNSANQVTRLNAIDGDQYKIDETTEGDTSTDRYIIVTTSGGEATGTIKIEVTYTYE
jgi:hypothetical protein